MVLSTKRLAVAGACALMGALATVPSAEAAFTLADCQGGSINGRGASFQATAQATWANGFVLTDSSIEPAACDAFTGFGGSVAYDPAGSGAGRSAFGGGSTGGVRDANIRFIGYDEPPTPTEQAQIEAGTSSTTDNGNLLTIPVTSAAITASVNVPDSCAVSGDPTNALIEQAFRGSTAVDTWGELYPSAITGTGGKTTAQCQATPITRVVRLDSSGTTFQWKAFLDQVVPGDLDGATAGVQTWRQLPGETGQTEYANTAWPNGTTVVRGTANGAGALADKLATTDGGIGYLDLATARGKGFAASGDKRWLRLQDGPTGGAQFNAPTASTPRGSNCSSTTQYSNVPANAEADWSVVYGAIPVAGYPACALTYAGAWDDAADVYGTTATEQARARTVKDYLQYVLSPTGVTDARSNDYGDMPAAVKAIADAGVNQLGWNK